MSNFLAKLVDFPIMPGEEYDKTKPFMIAIFQSKWQMGYAEKVKLARDLYVPIAKLDEMSPPAGCYYFNTIIEAVEFAKTLILPLFSFYLRHSKPIDKIIYKDDYYYFDADFRLITYEQAIELALDIGKTSSLRVESSDKYFEFYKGDLEFYRGDSIAKNLAFRLNALVKTAHNSTIYSFTVFEHELVNFKIGERPDIIEQFTPALIHNLLQHFCPKN